jgi:hypothetical protein
MTMPRKNMGPTFAVNPWWRRHSAGPPFPWFRRVMRKTIEYARK